MTSSAIDPVELARKLIACPSVTPYDVGAQDVLIDALEPLGFTAHDVSRGKVRNTFFRLGGEGPHFCFCGHTDVVPPGDEHSWSCPPFSGEVRGGMLYGRGAADMKGNIACFAAAVSRFLAGGNFKGSISLLITGDEEGEALDGTVKVLEWMRGNNHIPDAALVGEPTNPEKIGDEIKIGRRGSLSGTITVTGKQGHVAYPRLADNPLPKLVKLLAALAAHKFDEGSEYFPPTNLELTSIDTGNAADNVIPEKTAARFNVRFNDKWSAQSLSDKIVSLLDAAGADYKISFWSNAESFLSAPGKLAEMVSAAVAETAQRTPKLTTSGGTSDARFVARYCPVVEFGLVNKTIHQVDECVAVADMETLTGIYAGILGRFFK